MAAATLMWNFFVVRCSCSREFAFVSLIYRKKSENCWHQHKSFNLKVWSRHLSLSYRQKSFWDLLKHSLVFHLFTCFLWKLFLPISKLLGHLKLAVWYVIFHVAIYLNLDSDVATSFSILWLRLVIFKLCLSIFFSWLNDYIG